MLGFKQDQLTCRKLLLHDTDTGPLIQAFALMMIAVATEYVECPAYLEDEEESADHSRRCEWDHQTWQVRRTDHHVLPFLQILFCTGFFLPFLQEFFFCRTKLLRIFNYLL
jgi:hypothetical protein